MTLFNFSINSKKSAVIVFIIIGLFILAGGSVLLKAAKNNSETDVNLTPAAIQEVIDNNLDSDNDGLPDNLEKILRTDLKNPDTDNDDYRDEEEIKNGYSPLAVAPEGKYNFDEFEKIKADIQNFSSEVYDKIFAEKDESTASVSPTSAPIISPAASGSPVPDPSIDPEPTISPIPAVLKEKNINKDWAYILYIPQNFNENKEYPLVMVFNGPGGAISDPIDNWRVEADKNSFIIAALEPYEKKYPSGNVVESYPWEEAGDFVLSVFKDVKKDYKIDEKNIFLSGFSTGAATAYIVSLESGIKFKGVIPIGGYLPLEAGIIDKLINSNGVNFYVIHGANDANLKATIAQEKTLVQYGAKMNFATLPDFETSEYPIDEQENIAEWMKGLM